MLHRNTSKYRFFAGCLVLTVLFLVGCSKEEELTFSGGTYVQEDQVNQETGNGYEREAETEPQNEESDSVYDPATGTKPGIAESEDAESKNTESKYVESENAESDSGNGDTDSTETIYVQVTGAVHSPGVYEVSKDARVFMAVELAGGLTDDAAPEAVNQASVVSDGQMIVIPTRDEWERQKKQAGEEASAVWNQNAGNIANSAAGTGSGAENAAQQPEMQEPEDDRVNINTADKATLCTISGIGEVRAERILTYRSEHGPFRSIEEIKNVEGIKNGLYEKIKDKIKV